MSDTITQISQVQEEVQAQQSQDNSGLVAFVHHIESEEFQSLVYTLNFYPKYLDEIDRGVFDRVRLSQPLPEDASAEFKAMEQVIIDSTRHDFRESANEQAQAVEIELMSRMIEVLKIFSSQGIEVLLSEIEDKVKLQTPEEQAKFRKQLRKRSKIEHQASQEAKELADHKLREKILAGSPEDQMRQKILAEIAESNMRFWSQWLPQAAQ